MHTHIHAYTHMPCSRQVAKSPLFDTVLWVRHAERMHRLMWDLLLAQVLSLTHTHHLSTHTHRCTPQTHTHTHTHTIYTDE